jgi:hypothetical protein
MTDSTSASNTNLTEPWYASTGFWASAIMLAVAVLQAAATISAAPTFGEGVAAVDWTAWALGAAGLLVGIVRAVKGASPDSPTPRWTLGGGGTRGSVTTTVGVLVMGAALVLMLVLSSCTPGSGNGRLTPAQGGAVGQGVHLGCEMARLLLNPEITGVSPDVAGWVDRICEVGELVTVAVLPWVIDAPTASPNEKRLFLEAGPPVRTVAVSCEQIAAGCDQDGLDTPAAETCYEVLRGCRDGRAAVIAIAPLP